MNENYNQGNMNPYQTGTPMNPYQTGTPMNPYQQGAPMNPYQQGAPMNPYQQGAPMNPYQQGTPMNPYQTGAQTPVNPQNDAFSFSSMNNVNGEENNFIMQNNISNEAGMDMLSKIKTSPMATKIKKAFNDNPFKVIGIGVGCFICPIFLTSGESLGMRIFILLIIYGLAYTWIKYLLNNRD
ncbi:MAG: hypothetical protein J6A25_09980 [Lachnospiraceae bacterium]|nr:hypothetical protein [Lachnospiraceae bacterium]